MSDKDRDSNPGKRKILNDPVYGFITVSDPLLHDIVEHPYFQRLRRIKQVGMSHLVYPGANHTRFHHALGAMHLMREAILSLRDKGVEITDKEAQGAMVAILLHDIGHGPYSHSLEFSLVKNVTHEHISSLLMEKLNDYFDGALSTGIEIFRDLYPKHFLHQLVSSQLDMDRLDYLSRDSFFTGVSEGVVSNQRIIKMLDVVDDRLVVEEKGIYSIEKFIVARRLMYWQVYLHKTVVSAEKLLINILSRAKESSKKGKAIFASPALKFFLDKDYGVDDFKNNPEVINNFVKLDDYDIMGAIKVWSESEDLILSDLCQRLINRKLFRVKLSNEPFDPEYIKALKRATLDHLEIEADEIHYYLEVDELVNSAYDNESNRILILQKSGNIIDLAEASDNRALIAQTKTVKKNVLFCLKSVEKKLRG
ncbi:HD domain-containing protein [Cryomorphaceae bacterium 1068]|nr:HD domain-containing protein [Cryomorphaceae bacterium 1068]